MRKAGTFARAAMQDRRTNCWNPCVWRPLPRSQMAVLNNTAAEDLGDQDALEAELERELAAAEEEAEGVAGAVPQSKKKVR